MIDGKERTIGVAWVTCKRCGITVSIMQGQKIEWKICAKCGGTEFDVKNGPEVITK